MRGSKRHLPRTNRICIAAPCQPHFLEAGDTRLLTAYHQTHTAIKGRLEQAPSAPWHIFLNVICRDFWLALVIKRHQRMHMLLVVRAFDFYLDIGCNVGVLPIV
jgi:hypothetical protein